MHYDKKAIEQLDRVTRLKIINSVTGVKPGNLIGTINKNGLTNCYWQDNSDYLVLKCWRDEEVVEAYVEILYNSKVI